MGVVQFTESKVDFGRTPESVHLTVCHRYNILLNYELRVEDGNDESYCS